MIHLHTGLPGAGKTLCTLLEVKRRAESENRPVYYSGIADLKLPWIELDTGAEWVQVPDGAIIVIDEAQRIFRPRHHASTVPEYVAALETHRHRGLDLYIVTQHPKLVDANVRRLVGVHVHFVRAFGAKAVTRHEWGEVKEDPASRDDSQRSLVPYPAEAFAWYKSAEVHTHKVRLPRAVYVLALVPLLVGGLGYVAWRGLQSWGSGREAPVPASVDQAKLVKASPGKKAEDHGPGTSSADWLAQRAPRIQGLAYTAPAYDRVTEVTDAPYPAVCVSTPTRCGCYSQQGTRLDVPATLCRQFAASGFFKDWGERVPEARAAPSMGGGSGPPLIGAPEPATLALEASNEVGNAHPAVDDLARRRVPRRQPAAPSVPGSPVMPLPIADQQRAPGGR